MSDHTVHGIMPLGNITHLMSDHTVHGIFTLGNIAHLMCQPLEIYIMSDHNCLLEILHI